MQRIYVRSNEHFEVFTTVLAPQGRYRYRVEAEKMVAVYRYRPHWPDELELFPGDVILVQSKLEERWFGRLQDGQQGYFPASCVMELSQTLLLLFSLTFKSIYPLVFYEDTLTQLIFLKPLEVFPAHLLPKVIQRSLALRITARDGERSKYGNGHILQALRRGSRGGGGAEGGLNGGQVESRDPFLVQRPQVPPAQPVAPQIRRSPSLLHRILSKCRKKSECRGATNGAFESD